MAGTAKKGQGGKRGGAKKRKRVKYELEVAPDVQAEIEDLVDVLELTHVDPQRIVCFRSRGATAKIYARIWSLPKIWQIALGVEAHYAIEVVELYDRSSREDQTKTLIHELLHVPKTFSGALVPHKCFGKEINDEVCDELYDEYLAKCAVREAQVDPAAVPDIAVDIEGPWDEDPSAQPDIAVDIEGPWEEGPSAQPEMAMGVEGPWGEGPSAQPEMAMGVEEPWDADSLGDSPGAAAIGPKGATLVVTSGDGVDPARERAGGKGTEQPVAPPVGQSRLDAWTRA